MKWLLLFLIIIPFAAALDDCQTVMEPSDVPCLLRSSWTYDSCTRTTIQIYNSTPILIQSLNYSDYGTTGLCNITWNISAAGSYYWNDSQKEGGNITIDTDNSQYYLYITAIFLFFILLGIGYYKEEVLFVVMSGMICFAISIYLYNTGFPNLTSIFLKNSISVILFGVGAFLILAPNMEWLERVWT